MRQDDGTELQPGQQFGSYEIVRPLGKGAFGAVYEALRLPLRKRTALKVLHEEFVRHREVVGRFLREAEVVAQLEHPHIVGVFDVGFHNNVPFIAMDFLDGETLTARLEREGPLSIDVAVDIILPIQSAVATVHDKGIVHRDLKPDNVFLAQTSTGGMIPKLLDFGIAKVRDAEKSLTRTNAVMGTPFYMSPEQAEESKNITAAADQWSLAVILFECLTGRKPFEAESLIGLLNAICYSTAPSPQSIAPSIPDALSDAILRALQRESAKRFSTVREFGAAILPFASVGAQAQWSVFFNGSLSETGGASAARNSVLPSMPPEARRGGEALDPGTLAPSSRSTLGLTSTRSRAPWLAAGVAIAAFGIGGVIAMRGDRSSRAGARGSVTEMPVEMGTQPSNAESRRHQPRRTAAPPPLTVISTETTIIQGAPVADAGATPVAPTPSSTVINAQQVTVQQRPLRVADEGEREGSPASPPPQRRPRRRGANGLFMPSAR